MKHFITQIHRDFRLVIKHFNFEVHFVPLSPFEKKIILARLSSQDVGANTDLAWAFRF